jgi:hypothetical protein
MRSATAFPVSTGFVEPLVAVEEVVGAHDGGVAPDIAAADIALVSNCDIADAVVLREIERCRKAMAAAAHDHHVVCAWARRGARRATTRDGRRTRFE